MFEFGIITAIVVYGGFFWMTLIPSVKFITESIIMIAGGNSEY